MSREGGRTERIACRLLWAVLSATFFYLSSAALVLDFSSTAQDLCCEYDEQRRPVAHGPAPRIAFCHPCRYDVPGGASWDGSEWAFSVYRPICSVWLRMNGYGRAHARS